MARLIMLLLFAALVISVSVAVKSCSERTFEPSSSPSGDETGLVALEDGSTLIAQRGTIGRDLVDWLAARKPGYRIFELGGQEFVGRTAELTPQSLGRVPRLIAMLRANPDVRVKIIGHTDPSGEEAADQALSLARAEALSRFLREGGISSGRLSAEGHGAAEPIAPNNSARGRAKNQRVSLVLTRAP